jgi:hypothetical protein
MLYFVSALIVTNRFTAVNKPYSERVSLYITDDNV